MWLRGRRYIEKRIVLRVDPWGTPYIKLCLSLSEGKLYSLLSWIVTRKMSVNGVVRAFYSKSSKLNNKMHSFKCPQDKICKSFLI